jgi:hypothetical protein
MVYPALLPLIRTPRLPAVDWTDAPADLNGLVRFGERRNLVSVRVPSRFRRTLPQFHHENFLPNPSKVISNQSSYHRNHTSVLIPLHCRCSKLNTKLQTVVADHFSIELGLLASVKDGLWPCVMGLIWYSAFETWWHTVTQGWGSEGETGEWSG